MSFTHNDIKQFKQKLTIAVKAVDGLTTGTGSDVKILFPKVLQIIFFGDLQELLQPDFLEVGSPS